MTWGQFFTQCEHFLSHLLSSPLASSPLLASPPILSALLSSSLLLSRSSVGKLKTDHLLLIGTMKAAISFSEWSLLTGSSISLMKLANPVIDGPVIEISARGEIYLLNEAS